MYINKKANEIGYKLLHPDPIAHEKLEKFIDSYPEPQNYGNSSIRINLSEETSNFLNEYFTEKEREKMIYRKLLQSNYAEKDSYQCRKKSPNEYHNVYETFTAA